ncbi:MAG: 1-deoxy-D-xylulose-5-phosphate reductoisomerase [Phycisphaerales bacterium]|nr:1-deoxy-D-xylulose-5-phosphate reductoisomerase [Phycisphaerales bacterium]
MSRTRRVIVLGSTGSIGTNTLEVLEHLRGVGHEFNVIGLAAGTNGSLLAQQARDFDVSELALCDSGSASALGPSATVRTGSDSARQLVEDLAQPGDILVAAIVGSAGLEAVLEGIAKGCDIALANKETLVAGGALVLPLAKQHGVELLPVDSEHNAIAQCLRSARSVEEVSRLVITASGGPFRKWSRADINVATIEQALAHPTWTMGRKITIDSASLMNKALEVIEAHWLFGLPADQIDVIVHPQSIVHSFVEFNDGSVLSQSGAPSMKTPIQYALTSPDRVEGCSPKLDWASLRQLDFEPLDHDTFPSVSMAWNVIREGGTSGAIFNAANEVAVHAFLGGTLHFGGIFDLVEFALQSIAATPVDSLEDVLRADRAARDLVSERAASLGASAGGT